MQNRVYLLDYSSLYYLLTSIFSFNPLFYIIMIYTFTAYLPIVLLCYLSKYEYTTGQTELGDIFS